MSGFRRGVVETPPPPPTAEEWKKEGWSPPKKETAPEQEGNTSPYKNRWEELACKGSDNRTPEEEIEFGLLARRITAERELEVEASYFPLALNSACVNAQIPRPPESKVREWHLVYRDFHDAKLNDALALVRAYRKHLSQPDAMPSRSQLEAYAAKHGLLLAISYGPEVLDACDQGREQFQMLTQLEIVDRSKEMLKWLTSRHQEQAREAWEMHSPSYRIADFLSSMMVEVEALGAESGGVEAINLSQVVVSERETPTLAPLDGHPMLYRRRINGCHGEPGLGKTNLAVLLAHAAAQAGDVVWYIDAEDFAQGIKGKFDGFGCDLSNVMGEVLYFQAPSNAAGWQLLLKKAQQAPVELVILDGIAEMLAALGLREKDETEVLSFFTSYVRPFARTGAGVLILDHVAKDGETRGLWSRGSGAKMGAVDGVAYSLTLSGAYSPEREGGLILTCAKDRNGGVAARGCKVGEITFRKDGHRTLPKYAPANGQWQPTRVELAVLAFSSQHPGSSAKDFEAIPGGNAGISKALKVLWGKGLLDKQHDGRKDCYRITEAGAALL